tara:strand:- start:499 stop:852 length:354 start_codon:yes stop_codon:yes gene_type:complete
MVERVLYLFDYQGTLSTLPDPIYFIERLRQQDAECIIVVMSGGDVPSPLLAHADDFWQKGITVSMKLKDTVARESVSKVMLSEDNTLARKAYLRYIRSLCVVESVLPVDLPTLLTDR